MMQQASVTAVLLVLLLCSFVPLIFIIFIRDQNDSLISQPHSKYDYIVVGAGTSGCVLASKLSKNENKTVLLVEAGSDFGIISNVPLLTTVLQGSPNDWALKSTIQKYSSFGLENQQQSLPRGKGLGGSGRLNYMIHSENPDFTSFEKIGLDTDKLLYYYKNMIGSKINRNKCFYTDLFLEPEQYCAAESSEIKIHLEEMKTELTQIFFEAVKEFGPELKRELLKNTIRDGKRWTSYHGYLQPLKRNNLHIYLNSRVSKVLFNDKNEVTGIKINGHIVNANSVILTAGALHSPQILMLSGVGPLGLLKKHGIPVVVDLPVGKNLHDQLNVPLYVSIEEPLSVTIEKVMKLNEFWNYLFHNTGMYSNTPIAGMAKGPFNKALLLFGMGSTDEKVLREISNFKQETFRSLFPLYKNSSQEGFVLLSTCLLLRSRGEITLEDVDSNKLPLIDPNYLELDEDVDCLKNAIKMGNKMIDTQSFQNIGAKIHWPSFKTCPELPNDPKNDEYLECLVRTIALTAHHPGGTCKMGNDENAVVGLDFKVKHTKGLYVMDASVIPEPLTVFPNSVLISLAEYAADVISRG